MSETYNQWLIARRIACPEAGYPLCDARYASVTDWVFDTPGAATQQGEALMGWSIQRINGWIYFKRPDDFRQAITPDEPQGSHAETLYMLMNSLLSTPQQAASVQAAAQPPWLSEEKDD